eukprot:3839665-Prymnesium_polylepis.1
MVSRTGTLIGAAAGAGTLIGAAAGAAFAGWVGYGFHRWLVWSRAVELMPNEVALCRGHESHATTTKTVYDGN